MTDKSSTKSGSARRSTSVEKLIGVAGIFQKHGTWHNARDFLCELYIATPTTQLWYCYSYYHLPANNVNFENKNPPVVRTLKSNNLKLHIIWLFLYYLENNETKQQTKWFNELKICA